MYVNKFFQTLKHISKYNKRYIFYDIEKNKSYYSCPLCNSSKIIKCCFGCDQDTNRKNICDKCNRKNICDFCDDKGLKYYFSV